MKTELKAETRRHDTKPQRPRTNAGEEAFERWMNEKLDVGKPIEPMVTDAADMLLFAPPLWR